MVDRPGPLVSLLFWIDQFIELDLVKAFAESYALHRNLFLLFQLQFHRHGWNCAVIRVPLANWLQIRAEKWRQVFILFLHCACAFMLRFHIHTDETFCLLRFTFIDVSDRLDKFLFPGRYQFCLHSTFRFAVVNWSQTCVGFQPHMAFAFLEDLGNVYRMSGAQQNFWFVSGQLRLSWFPGF